MKTTTTKESSDIKHLLSNPEFRIELHTLVQNKTEALYKNIEDLQPQTQNVKEALRENLAKFEKESQDLRNIVACGSYFGTQEQAAIWENTLSELGKFPHSNGNTYLLRFQGYPALLILYAAGISALASENYSTLKKILGTTVTRLGHEDEPLPTIANCSILESAANEILELDNRKTPLSDHLHELFETTLPKEILFGKNFDDLFDRWEIILAMTVNSKIGRPWAPIGRFSWRDRKTAESIEKEILETGDKWPLIRVGVFGSEDEAKEILSIIRKLSQSYSFF